jgi:hypothetical protein
LYLVVDPSGARRWIVRVDQVNLRGHYYEINPIDLLSLTEFLAPVIAGQSSGALARPLVKEYQEKCYRRGSFVSTAAGRVYSRL